MSIGQEIADCAIIAYHNNPFVFGNHRSHGQYLAATRDIKGCYKQIEEGMSQHLFFKDKFMSNGIQGALSPVAYGMSLGFNIKKINRDVICFVGDGTLGQGVFYETLRHNLNLNSNITFVIIDNGYSMSPTPKLPDIKLLSQSFQIPFLVFNQKLFMSYESEEKNLKNFLYENKGMKIIYAFCDRITGHSCNDTQMYRPKYELTYEYKQEKDPLFAYSIEEYINYARNNI